MITLNDWICYAPIKNKEIIDPIYKMVMTAYQSPDRFYHNLNHIEYGLHMVNIWYPKNLTSIEFFAWMFHDVVYNSKVTDNEEQSAIIWEAYASALGFSDFEKYYVSKIILSTKITSQSICIVNDIDLAGLGSSQETYDTNTYNIRKEYNWVSENSWKLGRTAALTGLLARAPLYFTSEFRDAFESKAKENILRELNSLN